MDYALVQIIHLLVTASESCASGSHGDGLPVDTMVEAGDYDCIFLGALLEYTIVVYHVDCM